MHILVTGASSGIGAEVVRRLVSKKHTLIGLARDFKKLPLSSPYFHPIEVDLSDLKNLPFFLSDLLKKYPDIEAALLNAAQGLFGHLEQFSYQEIHSNFNLNFISQTYLLKALLPKMKREKKGTLIVMGSEAALQGKPKGALYCASKFALRGLVQSLRQECSKNHIRLSLIHPGPVKTPFFKNLNFTHGAAPENYCLPEEIADLVVQQLEAREGFVFEEIQLGPLKRAIVHKNGTL